MKKLILLLTVFAMVFSTACSKKEVASEVDSDASSQVSQEAPKHKNEYCKLMTSNARPVAVMIDNDVAASRPQAGLDDAYMIYEIVVEGGASRMMALFKNHDVEKVGPIRSSRHYFLDYALEHDAIYCHAGWSPLAQNDIPKLGVNNINGIQGNDGTVYWRDSTYDNTWHNLYSSVKKLFEKGTTEKGYRKTTDVIHNLYSDDDLVYSDASDAIELKLPYSNFYRVGYTYNPDKMVYERYVDGKPHMSQSGNILTAKNIIIYQLDNYALNDGDNKDRQDIVNTGTGTGYYVTNGKVIDINWSKPSRTEKTTYTTKDGKELVLNPGNTFVQIVPSKSTITIG